MRLAAVARIPLALLTTLAGLAPTGCQTFRGLSGVSVYCGDVQKLGFRFAELSFDRTGKDGSLEVWSATRRAKLGESVGVGGSSDITDVRLVSTDKGSGPTFDGAIGDNGRAVRVGSPQDDPNIATKDWVVDVFLSAPAAARLREAVDKTNGSRTVIAFLVGEKVFSVSVGLEVKSGVARIELPTRRDLGSARTLFEQSLACPATPAKS